MFKLSAGIVSKKIHHKWFSLEFLLPSRLSPFELFLIAQ
jgi:hypothetical protein